MCSTTSVALCNSEVAATLLSWLLVFAVCSVCAQPRVAKPSISTAVMINLCIHPPWRPVIRFGWGEVWFAQGYVGQQPWSGLPGGASHLLSSEFSSLHHDFFQRNVQLCCFRAGRRAAATRTNSRAIACPQMPISWQYRL